MSQKGRVSLSQAAAIYDTPGGKDADREVLQAYQHDIEDAIRRAVREEAERERLAQIVAPPSARARRDRMVHAQTLLDGIQVPEGKYREEQKFARAQMMRDQVSAAVAKKREAAQRKNADAGPIAPTPERIAKAGEYREGEQGMLAIVPPIDSGVARTTTRAYTVAPPLEQSKLKESLPQEELAAATRAVCDILTAEAGPRVTASYEGMPAGVYGARAGGVQDYVREKQAIVEQMRSDLDAEWQRVIDWVMTCTVIKQDGSSMTLADLGRRISPWAPGEKGANDVKVAWGFFRATCTRLKEWYALQDAMGRFGSVAAPSPEMARRLLTSGTARMQAMRERAQRQLERDKGDR